MRFACHRKLMLLAILLLDLYNGNAEIPEVVNHGAGKPASDSIKSNRISVIPNPLSVQRFAGFFIIPQNITITCNVPVKEIEFCAHYLKDKISHSSKHKVFISSKPASKGISLKLLEHAKDTSLGNEGYRLSVSKNGIIIKANSAAGIFYGIQSLLQLLPAEIESNLISNQQWEFPLVEIMDRPIVGWRGLMLDVARHFFGVNEVKKFIDNMVKYKFNLLHLHLTDDEGWRIEIKSLPMLTKVGAWRAKKVGTFGFFSPPLADEPRTYGGFFTQEDIREIIQYAKQRFVNVLPEIDMPGHSLAAIASYPYLSSTGLHYPVNSGEKVMEWPANEEFYALVDNSLCAAKPEVYKFADQVLTEVAQLFPFEYIHIGGDENAKNFWKESKLIADLMKNEHLADLQEVEYYFIKRIENIVHQKGKKMIGWDEITGADLDTSSAVMSYRDKERGINAAKKGHPVIMDPQKMTYLNYQQGDSAIEPHVHSTLLLETAYRFNPFEGGINTTLLKGIEGNLWTEQVYTERHLEYMIWPRALAIAESGWSVQKNKKWTDFITRVEDHFHRLTAAGIKYSPALYDVVMKPYWKNNSLMVDIQTQIPGMEVHYSFDNSYPDNFYPSYKEKLEIPVEASLLRLVTYRNGAMMGRMTTIPVNDLKRRAGIK